MRTTQTELVLPRLHPAQRGIKRDARRFNVLACGRRFGKTMLGHDLAIHPLLKGQPVGWFAPTYKVLIEAWQAIVRLLHPVTRRLSEQEKRIELWTGGVFEAWSLENPDAGRSRKYGRVLIDEAGLSAKLMASWSLTNWCTACRVMPNARPTAARLPFVRLMAGCMFSIVSDFFGPFLLVNFVNPLTTTL